MQCIALTTAMGTAGCAAIVDEPEAPAAPTESAALKAAEAQFAGRWYALDPNLSCQTDKVVTFADGKAEMEGQYARPAVASDDPAAFGMTQTLPYRIDTDAGSGLHALVVDRDNGEDRYWLAGPDFLLALNAEGYDVLAHCD